MGDHVAAQAIDLEMGPYSWTAKNQNDEVWLKVKLGEINCIQLVIWYGYYGNHERNWTCTSSDCSTCEGEFCSNYLLTVSSERKSSDDLPPIADCKYGDTVKLEKYTLTGFSVREIAVTGKQGKTEY